LVGGGGGCGGRGGRRCGYSITTPLGSMRMGENKGRRSKIIMV